MDDLPPPSPDSEPLLDRTFLKLFFLPLVSMVLAMVLSQVRDGGTAQIGVILSLVSLLAMFVCSILCAVNIGKRKGRGTGILTFVIVQVFYVAASFAGCTATLRANGFK